MPTVIEKRITPEELLRMDDGPLYELIDGQLVEKNLGGKAFKIATRLGGRLDIYGEKHNAGHAIVEGMYTCFRGDPERMRRPDVSFILAGRLPNEEVPDGYITIAPDVAVEVVSPNDTFHDIDERLADYFKAGVQEVWTVNTNRRTVSVVERDGMEHVFREKDKLVSEVLPGFELLVSELFKNIKVVKRR